MTEPDRSRPLGARGRAARPWSAALFAVGLLGAPLALEAQPAPLRVVTIGDSVRVYEPTRIEGSVLSAGPLGLVVQNASRGTVTFEPDVLGRFEVYTGFVPRGPRIVEGTLIGLGAGLIPMLTLIGRCSGSCAYTGMAVLGGAGSLLGGLIGGTTAGPQWRGARLPPGDEPGTVRPAGGAMAFERPTAHVVLLRIPL